MKRILQGIKIGFRDDGGQALVLAVVAMTALMGFVGLAIDVGNLRADERKLQQTADAAALAGALELSYCTYTSGVACQKMEDAATSSVTENGFSTPTLKTNTCTTPSITGITLVLNWGPCLLGSSDPNNGSKYAVEAQVGQKYGTYFASVLGLSTVTLTARAEAGSGNSGYCMYVDTKDYGTVPGTGTLAIESGGHTTLNCGIQDDGTLSAKGNGSHLTATQFEVSASSGTGSNQFSPAPSFNAPQIQDPLCLVYSGSLSSYSQSSCTSNTVYHQPTCTSWTVLTGPVSGTLSPGCYSAPSSGCSPVSVKNNGFGNDVNTYCDAVTLNGNLTLQPPSGQNGMYVFNGDLDLGGYNLTGTGVTLYFQGGSLINGNGSQVTLTAPANDSTPSGGSGANAATVSGSYQAMLLWQSPIDANTMELASGSTSVWSGIIYVPDGILDLSDGANEQAGCTTGVYSILDAYTVEDSHGSKTFNLCFDFSTLASGNPIKAYTAVLSE